MAGSGRAQKNKAHKTRFSSKSSRRDHKLAGTTKEKNSKKSAVQQSAKELRLQRNKNIRDSKRAILLSERRGIKGDKSAPRVLVLVPLDSRAQTGELKKRIVAACLGDESCAVDAMETENPSEGSLGSISIPRLKFRLTVLEAPYGDLQTCLQAVKVADIVAFVFSVAENDENVFEKSGKPVLSMLKAQGLPHTIGIPLGLGDVASKKRADVWKLYHDRLEAEFPPHVKTFDGSSNDEAQQMLRHISEQRPSHLQWRSQRPYVMAEQLAFEADSQSPSVGTLRLSGYVREQSLSVNKLIHISGIGDFQLEKMEILDDPCPLSNKKFDGMAVDAHKEILPDPNKQEALVIENILDPLAGEQTWPTEEELAKADVRDQGRKRRKLPKGTSDYQASWIMDESDEEEGSDIENAENTQEMQCDDEYQDDASRGAFEEEETEADTSEMMDDEPLSISQRKEEIQRLKEAVRSDEEFPDEVDTPMDVPARERFARYRGLKSMRTSAWDPKESLPADYARIFAFDNFNRTMKHVTKKASCVDEAFSACTGSFVRLHIRNFSSSVAASLLESYRTCPLVACGLFQHESKMTVVHFSIKKNDSFTEPIKSKENLLFHIGFRSYFTRPIFSTDDINMNKHKYERFLHAGRFSVASVIMPVQFPPGPLVVFKRDAQNLHYVASGLLKNADPDRIILKKIILSGYPLRVSKRKAIVRYMFHNPEDVKWFKPLELWTKYGRRGRIMEPVGTRGAMKCVFDGVVQQRDAVCVNLYKRVYPKWPQQ
ncbi:pre-rRNA-processing protein TSR1 homolog [Selaginella moellendorffii]|uniref:pre-rRNA-processing protein TSR1 homolog n=1 Tax=Selaginella moellendorffii TaxID=88036 RepID=UPI000D1CFA69|nr:pre-rRNA-processing protein TSR1 homolog [Selaginella moellendorffii]|eukprot:XP_024515686.1 pre-rRNA-processing protein TSR1 homolog [Selaginella moellendorffii]